MGLDQYLYAEQRHPYGTPKHKEIRSALSKEDHQNLVDEDWGYSTYISGWNVAHMTPHPAYQKLMDITGMIPDPGSPHFDVALDGDAYLVRATALYWRKANHIHRWFVENIQDGVDECQLSRAINGEELAELVERCLLVLKTPLTAAKLLPTESGFFFGGVEYDEYYIDQTKYTVDRLTELVETYPKPLVLRYRSSW
jgi:hypothetical protein